METFVYPKPYLRGPISKKLGQFSMAVNQGISKYIFWQWKTLDESKKKNDFIYRRIRLFARKSRAHFWWRARVVTWESLSIHRLIPKFCLFLWIISPKLPYVQTTQPSSIHNNCTYAWNDWLTPKKKSFSAGHIRWKTISSGEGVNGTGSQYVGISSLLQCAMVRFYVHMCSVCTLCK